jgi:hypothetical protein
LSRILKRLGEINFRNVSSIKPSKSVIAFITIALSIFILGGGVYDIMERPMAVLPTPGNPSFHPDISQQFLTESISFIFLLVIGVPGGYISFRSTRHAYRPREAKMTLALGVLMLILAVIGSEAALLLKMR